MNDSRAVNVSLAWMSYFIFFLAHSVVLSLANSTTSLWRNEFQFPDIPTAMLSLSGIYIVLSPVGLALSVFQANVRSRRSAFVVCGALVIGVVNYLAYVNPFSEPPGHEHMWLRWLVETVVAVFVIGVLPALSWYETARRD